MTAFYSFLCCLVEPELEVLATDVEEALDDMKLWFLA